MSDSEEDVWNLNRRTESKEGRIILPREQTFMRAFIDNCDCIGMQSFLNPAVAVGDFEPGRTTGLANIVVTAVVTPMGSIFGGRGAKFTALEYALYTRKPKMAALFIVNGADPANNMFDGEAPCSYTTSIKRRGVVKDFDIANPKPIKGILGLQRIVKKHRDNKCKALLRLFETLTTWSNARCYFGSWKPLSYGSFLEEDFENIMIQCIATLMCSSTMESSIACHLRGFAMTALRSLKRMGLPNETSLCIVESALLGKLWLYLESYAEVKNDCELLK